NAFDGHRIVDFELASGVEEAANHLQTPGVSNVVCVRLEGEAEHPDQFRLEGSQDLLNLGEEPEGPLVVDMEHRLQQAKVVSGRRCRLNEGGTILRETGSSETKARLQEGMTDPPVQSHPVRHLAHI